MRIALADPPYLGTAAKHYGEHHAEASVYDTLAGHTALVQRLVAEFPDGWALCLGSTSLRAILPLCPEGVRIGSWVKPFCSWKKGVNPAYCWEPVIFLGGRQNSKRPRWKVRDYCAIGVTLKRGLVGAKPEGWCFWVFQLLGMDPGDELVDLFPGSGAVEKAWANWKRNYAGLLAGVEDAC